MKERLRAVAARLYTLVVVNLDLRDLFAFGGLAMVGYGLAQIHPPAAWIVCGAALFWLGVRNVRRDS